MKRNNLFSLFAITGLLLLSLLVLPAYALATGSTDLQQLPKGGAFVQTGTFTGTLPLTHALYLPGVLNNAGGDRRLTHTPTADDFEPAFSPDGQTIAFASDRTGRWDIFTVPITGGEAVNLTQIPLADEDTPVFSPDGNKIAFASNRSGGWDIYLMDLDGGSVQPIVSHPGTGEVHPTFAPDGQTVVFSSDLGGNWDIYTTSIVYGAGNSSANWHRLTTDAAADRFPTLSADGRQIVFRSERDGNSEIYLMEADGSDQRRLTNDPAFDGYPSFTPDGSGVIFVSNRSGQWNTYLVNIAGGGTVTLGDNPGQQVYTPRLSPDGTQMVYAGGAVGEKYDIYLREDFASPLLTVGRQGLVNSPGNCDWEGGVLAMGWSYAWRATQDVRYLQWARDWIDSCMPAKTEFTHVNDGLLGYAALIAYQGYNQPEHLAFAEDVADYLLHTAARTADGTLMHVQDTVWDDTLVSVVPFLLEMNTVTSNTLYFDEAITQVVKHAEHLQDPASGLYYHAWRESTAQTVGSFWARGNSWIIFANSEALSAMPITHPMHGAVLDAVQKQATELKSLQDDSGLWRTVVTRPDFYLETSASALIGYGLKRGVETGWLEPGEYATTAQAALEGVWRVVLADGTVTGVSAPTSPQENEGAYNAIPNDSLELYGQGMALLLGSAHSPLILRDAERDHLCEEIFSKTKVWQGGLNWNCDAAAKKAGAVSLRLNADAYSIAERYSPLIPVEPDRTYEISYWVKTDLEINGADLYGRVVAAQYNASAQEDDEVDQNRLDAGFALGESVGGQTDWVLKLYTFTTHPETAYVRLRALMGGATGTVRGSAWFDQVGIREQ